MHLMRSDSISHGMCLQDSYLDCAKLCTAGTKLSIVHAGVMFILGTMEEHDRWIRKIGLSPSETSARPKIYQMEPRLRPRRKSEHVRKLLLIGHGSEGAGMKPGAQGV